MKEQQNLMKNVQTVAQQFQQIAKKASTEAQESAMRLSDTKKKPKKQKSLRAKLRLKEKNTK